LSDNKLRPAVVLAEAGRGDWILCQITSNPYGDAQAVVIEQTDFEEGMLRLKSFARRFKLFTANQQIFVSVAGKLKAEKLDEIRQLLLAALSGGQKSP
jgi:mRNA interferase MazF